MPERGVEFTSTIAPWIAPDPLYTTYPTITHYPTKAPTTAAQKEEAAANAPAPAIAVPKEPPLGSIVTAEPSYVPTAGEDSQGKAPSSASSTTLKSRRLFIGVVVGAWTSYAVVLM